MPILLIPSGIPAPPPPAQFPAVAVEAMFTGSAWTDITPYVRLGGGEVAISRGSSRIESPVIRYDPGTASLTLDNRDRRFDPTNLAGPYVSGGGTATSQTGAFLSPAAMGEPSYTQAVTDWQTWIGSPLKVTRVYYALSSFPTVDATLSYLAAHDIKACIDLKPAFNPTSSTDRTNLGNMLAFWQAQGLDAEISLWAEPFNAGLTSGQFTAMWSFYAPTVRAHYPAVFCTSALTVQNNSENTFYPGDSLVDKITTDLYAIRYFGNSTRLDQAASIADAASPPKPFGLWEFNGSPQGTNFLTGDLTNFAATISTWTGAGNCATTWQGAAVMRMRSLAAGDMTAAHCAAANITTQGLPCVPGDSIRCNADITAVTNARSCQTGATFYTSGGVLISTLLDTAVSDSTSGVTTIPGTVTAPATAAFCRATVRVQATGAINEDHNVSRVTLGNLNTGQSQTDITTYFNYVQSYFANRIATGKVNADLLFFNSGSASNAITTPIISSTDFRLALLRNIAAGINVAAATQVLPMVPVRISATYASVTYRLFYGTVDAWTLTYTPPQDSVTSLSATDGFKQLSLFPRVAKNSYQGGGEDSGARVKRILNNVGWPTSQRSITDGDATLQATLLGSTPVAGTPAAVANAGGAQTVNVQNAVSTATALDELQLVGDTEMGELYIDGRGFVVFRRRSGIFLDSRSIISQAVFGDNLSAGELGYQSVTVTYDIATLYNGATIANQGGNLQQTADTISQARYGPVVFDSESLIANSDFQSLGYAQHILTVSKDPELRFSDITVTPRRDPVNLFPQVLGRQIGDRVTIIRRPPGGGDPISRDVFIRGISHAFSSKQWQTTWILEDATNLPQPFIIGDAINGVIGVSKIGF